MRKTFLVFFAVYSAVYPPPGHPSRWPLVPLQPASLPLTLWVCAVWCVDSVCVSVSLCTLIRCLSVVCVVTEMRETREKRRDDASVEHDGSALRCFTPQGANTIDSYTTDYTARRSLSWRAAGRGGSQTESCAAPWPERRSGRNRENNG